MRNIVVIAAIAVLAACGTNDSGPVTAMVPTMATPPAAAPVNRAFDITFAADPVCTMLPDIARTRKYSATGGAAGFVLGNARFGPVGGSPYGWNVIYSQAVNGGVRLWFQDPEIWERLTPQAYVVIYGGADGTIGDAPTTFPFWGRVTFCAEVEEDTYPECEVPEVTCQSSNHRVTVTPR